MSDADAHGSATGSDPTPRVARRRVDQASAAELADLLRVTGVAALDLPLFVGALLMIAEAAAKPEVAQAWRADGARLISQYRGAAASSPSQPDD